MYFSTAFSFKSTKPWSPPVKVFFAGWSAAAFVSATGLGASAAAGLPRKLYPSTPAPTAAAPITYGVADDFEGVASVA